MTEPLRVGILSTAKIADAILTGARLAAGAEVVAVASRDGGRAEAYAAEKGIPRAHGSYEALLADEDVEAVYVPLPNSMHLPWAVKALEAGKHVLCEKPLSRRAADVEAAFDAAERAGRILMEAFMWRYHPATEKVVSLVGEGAVGELRVVRAAFGFTLHPEADNVRWSGELEGGALMDVGCYCVSALRLLAGEPERVSAELVDGGDGVDARLAGLARFGGDVLGTFDCSFDVPYRAAIEVVGSTGTIASLDPWHGRSPALRILRQDADQTAHRATTTDPDRTLTDLLLLTAAVASLAAVGTVLVEAAQLQGSAEGLRVGLGLASVVLSWAMVHTIYTLRYAHLYYAGPDGGIDFNGSGPPTYHDFAYLAFTIGMTFQVSDTAIKAADIRRAALRHALLSYLFGTGILASTINLVASLSSK